MSSSERAAMSGAAEDSIAEQAARWIVALTSDDPAERVQAMEGFMAWKQLDPQHASVAASMEHFLGRVQTARRSEGGNHGVHDRAPAAVAALNASFSAAGRRPRRPGKRLKSAGVLLLLAVLFCLPLMLSLQVWSPRYLMADVHTAAGKWQTKVLDDGSRITLNGFSAVNLHFDSRRRTLELVQGEVLVEVAHDAARPFVVETSHGSIRALGTRFIVSREDNVTVLSMLESRVAVQTAMQRAAASKEEVVVSAGESVRISAGRVGDMEAADAVSLSTAWASHQLVVQERPMSEVLDALSRYRRGTIHYDRAQLADLKVSAVLPLDDTGRALQLLQDGFPALRIRTLTPYLVLVDAPGHRGADEAR